MKFILTVLTFFVTLNVNAQRQATPIEIEHRGSLGSEDTIGLSDFTAASPVLYASPNGGYAFGVNGYGDEIKAQTYVITDSLKLKGVALLFGAKKMTSLPTDSSFIEVMMYSQGDTGYLRFQDIGPRAAPDTVVAYARVMLEDVDTAGFTYVDFSWMNFFLQDTFSFAVRLTGLLPGDTVGLLSTTDNLNGGTDMAWEFNDFGEWVKVSNAVRSWGLDVNLAIFPVVYPDAVSVPETAGLHTKLFPSPNDGQFTVSGISGAPFRVVDSTGRTVASGLVPENGQMDLTHLPVGIYTLLAEIKGETSHSRLVIGR